VIGIDEHTLHRGQRFVTTFCNLKNRRVFDVVEGKSQADLLSFLSSLKGRDKVKGVCIDLCSSYCQLIRKWFPNAKIVADRFHVVRIIQYHFLSFCRALVPEIKNPQGLVRCLRKQPVIRELYKKQLELRGLVKLKTLGKESVRQRIPEWLGMIAELKACSLEVMTTLGNTLESWSEEITRMWRFTRSNGITEGFHRKMKLFQRRAYGFRNFENYQLRVIAQWG
jgi:transposase